MKKLKILFITFIGVVILLSSPTISTQEHPEHKKLINLPKVNSEQQRLKILYPTTSFKYRGVVAGNIAYGDTGYELLCDFGNKGVWFYDPVGGWSLKSPDNPDFLIGVDFDDTFKPGLQVLGDFGSKGLWFFSYDAGGGTWHFLSPDSPTDAIATDDDGDGHDEIQADFGVKGIWRYDYDTDNWTFMTGDNPSNGLRSDFWSIGIEEGIWSFSSGTWSCWWTGAPHWDIMSGDRFFDDNVSAELGIGDSSEEVVLDFDTKGVWATNKEGSSETWYQLTPDILYDIRAVRFVGATDYELVATFFRPGLWMWNTAGTFPGSWTLLTGDTPTWDEAFCEPFDPNGVTEVNGDEELAADFGDKGLWLYDSTYGSWTKLTSDSPRFMVRADLFGHGVDDCLICDFSTKGLYYYDGSTSTWHLISPDSPDP